jgi:MerR family copper efflux transcriptional regulator
MHMSIGDLASRTGETVKTLRYYTDLGLLEAQRGENKYRCYGTGMVRRVGFIRHMQALGLSLSEIQAVVTLRSQGLEPCDEVSEQIATHLASVRRRIEELRKLEAELATRLEWATTHPDPECNDEATVCVYLGEPEEDLA